MGYGQKRICKLSLLKFDVDEGARGKSSLRSIGGVLCDNKGKLLCLFSKSMFGTRK